MKPDTYFENDRVEGEDGKTGTVMRRLIQDGFVLVRWDSGEELGVHASILKPSETKAPPPPVVEPQ